MGIGISIFLIAAGAVMTFAVSAVTDGVNLDTAGIVLMIVGAIGLVASMIIAGSGGRSDGDTTTVVR
jgi:hypothetical protein